MTHYLYSIVKEHCVTTEEYSGGRADSLQILHNLEQGQSQIITRVSLVPFSYTGVVHWKN